MSVGMLVSEPANPYPASDEPLTDGSADPHGLGPPAPPSNPPRPSDSTFLPAPDDAQLPPGLPLSPPSEEDELLGGSEENFGIKGLAPADSSRLASTNRGDDVGLRSLGESPPPRYAEKPPGSDPDS